MDLQLPVQSVHITTKVVSSNTVHGEVYSIQHYVIKFENLSVTPDRSVVFSGYSGFLHNKTDRHEITEISLKVALNTIIPLYAHYSCIGKVH